MNFDVKMDMLNALRSGMSMDEVAKMLTQQINDAKATYDKEQEQKKIHDRSKLAEFSISDGERLRMNAVAGKITAEDVAAVMRAYAFLHTDMSEEEIKDIYTAHFVEQIFRTATHTMNMLNLNMPNIDGLMANVKAILNSLNSEENKTETPTSTPKEQPRVKVKTNLTPEEADWALRKFLDGLR